MSHGIKRSDFSCYEDYAQTVHEAGGFIGERYSIPASPSSDHYTCLLRAIHGSTPDDRIKADEDDLDRDQKRNPHKFVRKGGAGRPRKRKPRK